MNKIGIIISVLVALFYDVTIISIIVERGGLVDYIHTNPFWDVVFFATLLINFLCGFSAWILSED